MDNKIKININTESIDPSFQDAKDFFVIERCSIENVFNFFLQNNNLIEDFSFSGSLELELSLVSDLEIRSINNEFRSKDKPTDVLSICLFSDFRNEWRDNNLPMINLGDIIISVDTAKKQSEEAGITLQTELLELFIHGTLHLLGFDHEKSEEEMRIMYKKEQEIFDHYLANKN